MKENETKEQNTDELVIDLDEVVYTNKVTGDKASLRSDDGAFLRVAAANGFDKTTVKKFQKLEEAYMVAAVDRSVVEAEKILKDDTNLKSVKVSTIAGTGHSNRIDATIRRERTVTWPGKDGKTQSKTRSDLIVERVSPAVRLSKPAIQSHQEALTKALLG